MQVDVPSRPRLIDRLRFFQVFRRHIGEEDANEVADALQDEFAEVASPSDIRELMLWIDGRINAAVLKMVVASGAIAGIALAIARLT